MPHRTGPQRDEPPPLWRPRPVVPPPHNLPPELTSFVQREDEVRRIRALLATTRLVTLTGTGGAGKTRLALRVAAVVRDEFPDGVFFVPLAGVAHANLVARAIAQALGVTDSGQQSLVDSLGQYIGRKRLLLVLDNFEHVMAARDDVADLLATTERLTILVTSLDPLHIYGEHQFPVLPLALPSEADARRLSPGDLMGNAAVRLFVERAQAVQPHFALNTDNARDVVAICRRVDGLPLAIELAAARISMFPPHALLARLDHRLSLLTGGPVNLSPRQQTLRNTLDWSYNLLDPGEQALFRRLAVFRGSFDLDIVAALGESQGDAAEGVAALLDKSLLMTSPSAGADGDAARFAMLETVREYALEQLTHAGEAAGVQRAHARVMLDLAERAAPELTSGRRGPWLSRLDLEIDNLRAALEWAVADGTDASVTLGLRLAAALLWFWRFRGYAAEGQTWVAQLVDLPLAATPAARETRAAALVSGGALAWLRDDHATARAWLEESARLAQTAGQTRVEAYALANLGQALMGQQDFAAARAVERESVRLFRALDDRWGLAQALLFLGRAERDGGDHEAARAAAEASLRLFTDLGDEWAMALSLSHLAFLDYLQGDTRQARQRLEQRLAIEARLGDKWSTNQALLLLANIDLAEGDFTRAAGLCRRGMAGLREFGLEAALVDPLDVLGCALAGLGQYEAAARVWGAATAIREASRLTPSAGRRADIHFDAFVARARDALGAERLAAAIAAGAALSLDDAVALAAPPASPDTAALSAASPAIPPAPTTGSPLTPRETEVLRLIAQGRTNQQIAVALTMSTHTVHRHISHILTKLDAPSRSAAVATATQRGWL